MPTYLYQAYTREGSTRKGRIEAADEKEARERLLREGLYARVLRLPGVGGTRGLPAAGRAMLYRELGALLHAGLPLDKALGVLTENPGLKAGAASLAGVRDEVREGRAFSEAMARFVSGMEEDERAVLRAGEASGNLAGVCEELAGYLEAAAEVREQVKTALIYPSVVASLALVVLGLMVGLLLPVYDRLLTGLNTELPGVTRVVLKLGRTLRSPWGLLLILFALAGLARGICWIRRNPGALLARTRYRLPILGLGLASLARARFARTLSLLLRGGIPLPDALRTAGMATGSRLLRDAGERMAEKVSHGERLSEALETEALLGEELPGWARAGEASGDLADLFAHAARGQARTWERSLRRSLALLEPMLILAVGLLILSVALAVLLPMLQLNRGLGA